MLFKNCLYFGVHISMKKMMKKEKKTSANTHAHIQNRYHLKVEKERKYNRPTDRPYKMDNAKLLCKMINHTNDGTLNRLLFTLFCSLYASAVCRPTEYEENVCHLRCGHSEYYIGEHAIIP